MKTIDLTTPAAALAYLRSLPSDTAIELPGPHDSRVPSPAVDAVSVIANESPNSFGIGHNRWDWTASDLVSALLIGRSVYIPQEGAPAEIKSIHPDGDVYLRFEDGAEGSYAMNELEF